MAFSTTRTVRFGETDPAGIVYFSRFYEYAHEAYEDMLQAGGFPLSDVFSGQWAMPLVRSEADYSIPSRLGDALNLTLSVDNIGNRSVRYRVDIQGVDGALRARIQHTHATVDLKTGKTCAVPDRLIEALKASGALEE